MEILPTTPEAPNYTPLSPNMMQGDAPAKQPFYKKIKVNMIVIVIILAVLFIISLAAYFFTRPQDGGVPAATTPASGTDQTAPAAQPTTIEEAGSSATTEVASSEGDVESIPVSEVDSDLQDVKTDLEQL